jgi:CelD/BcsL family acetyltransferase involved in cellulose biosynthesis
MTGAVLSDHNWRPALERQAQEMLDFNQRWLDLITRVYGYQALSLTTRGPDGAITGYLPICALQGAFGRMRLVAIPFSDTCPLLAKDDATTNELVDQAIELARRHKARYLELRAGVNDALAARPDLTAQNLYARHWLPLEADAEAIWAGLRKSVRGSIRKARKLGVRARVAQTLDDVDSFYRLHLRTRTKKHGMPTQPRRFFHDMWNTFSPDGAIRILLAEYEGIPIAAIVLLASGRTVRYAYSASDERYLHLDPVYLLMWEAISWGCGQGFERLDLGRSARDNHGLMAFKRHLGGVEEPLPYYYHPHVAGLAATAESSWRARALAACWKRLPLWLAEPVGGHLYKHLG